MLIKKLFSAILVMEWKYSFKNNNKKCRDFQFKKAVKNITDYLKHGCWTKIISLFDSRLYQVCQGFLSLTESTTPNPTLLRYSIVNALKICKLGDQVLRISQEFPEKHSGEFLRNFLGWNSEDIPKNFSKLILFIKFPLKSVNMVTES